MIAILWVKVLIFQGAKPIFNVGSLSKGLEEDRVPPIYIQEEDEEIQDSLDDEEDMLDEQLMHLLDDDGEDD